MSTDEKSTSKKRYSVRKGKKGFFIVTEHLETLQAVDVAVGDRHGEQGRPVALEPSVHVQKRDEYRAHDDPGAIDLGRVQDCHAEHEPYRVQRGPTVVPVMPLENRVGQQADREDRRQHRRRQELHQLRELRGDLSLRSGHHAEARPYVRIRVSVQVKKCCKISKHTFFFN